MSNLPMIQANGLGEMMEFAKVLSQSALVPRDYQNRPQNVLAAIQWGMEIGLSPMQAMQNIAVINGRPSIWGDAALALVRASGLLESFDEKLVNGVASCTVKRKGEPPQTREFSELDAKRAKLWGKRGRDGQDTPWTTYPQRMLQMRARSWALRDVFPDVLKGMYIREEAEDIPTAEGQERVTIAAEPAPVAIAAPAESVEEAEVIEMASEAAKAEILAKVQQIEMSREAFAVLLKNRRIKWGSISASDAMALRAELGQTAREIEREKNLALSAEYEASKGGAA